MGILTARYIIDPEALQGCVAVSTRPLDEGTIARVLAEFPGLKVERRDGYLIAPWHGREGADRGDAFTARARAETGCLFASQRNGRTVELGRETARAVA